MTARRAVARAVARAAARAAPKRTPHTAGDGETGDAGAGGDVTRP